MERDRHLAALRAALRSALATATASLLLAGCGPGTGGTGLPPGSDTASVDAVAPSTVASPGPQLSIGTVAAPRPLPARAPDLEGTFDRVDDATLSIAGRALPRALADVVLADGTVAPADAPRVGGAAHAWLENGRWLVLLP